MTGADDDCRPTSGRGVIPTGSLVLVKTRKGAGKVGLVVGPDQHWFPRPKAVFVQLGDRVRLIDVTDLTAVPGPPEARS